MISDDDLLLFHWQDGLDDTRRREIADALSAMHRVGLVHRDRGLVGHAASILEDVDAHQAPGDGASHQ